LAVLAADGDIYNVTYGLRQGSCMCNTGLVIKARPGFANGYTGNWNPATGVSGRKVQIINYAVSHGSLPPGN
jgi:hypothetical protein